MAFLAVLARRPKLVWSVIWGSAISVDAPCKKYSASRGLPPWGPQYMHDVKFHPERALGRRAGDILSHLSIVVVGRVFGQSEHPLGWWFGDQQIQ